MRRRRNIQGFLIIYALLFQSLSLSHRKLSHFTLISSFIQWKIFTDVSTFFGPLPAPPRLSLFAGVVLGNQQALNPLPIHEA